MPENMFTNVPPRRSSLFPLLLILVLVAGISAAFYYLVLPNLGAPNPPLDNNVSNTTNEAEIMASKFNSATEQLNADKPEAAIAIFDEMLATASDDATRNSLTIRKASAMFATGDIPLSFEAIDMLGNLLVAENVDSMFRGWAVAELLQFHFLSQHTEILAKIRGLQIFSKLSALPLSEFLLEAAKMSDVLYPTTFGKIYLATPLAMELTYSDLNQEAREKLAKEIEALANKSIALEEDEGWSKAPYNVMLAYHYRGIVLSAAVKGGTDPAFASQQFSEAIKYANEQAAVTSVQKLAFYSHFYYAAHLLESGNTSGADAQLAQLINKINTIDSPEFQLFVRTAHENTTSNNYQLFQALTAQNAAFKEVLAAKYDIAF